MGERRRPMPPSTLERRGKERRRCHQTPGLFCLRSQGRPNRLPSPPVSVCHRHPRMLPHCPTLLEPPPPPVYHRPGHPSRTRSLVSSPAPADTPVPSLSFLPCLHRRRHLWLGPSSPSLYLPQMAVASPAPASGRLSAFASNSGYSLSLSRERNEKTHGGRDKAGKREKRDQVVN
jgi:hypothetical protein